MKKGTADTIASTGTHVTKNWSQHIEKVLCLLYLCQSPKKDIYIISYKFKEVKKFQFQVYIFQATYLLDKDKP